MADLQGKTRFERRPSFWKTPITHSSSQTIGHKRNYCEIHNTNSNSNNLNNNPNKKRRLLTEREIEDIAKYGGFNPKDIYIAVEECDGFKWFKRAPINTQKDKEKYLEKYWNIKPNINSNVLRELSKEELIEKSKQKEKNNENESNNPNDFNKQQALQLQKAAKLRRHTAPPHKLKELIKNNNINKKQRKKKIKKIIEYKTKKEIIKKKKKIKRRIVYKKKIRTTKVKITTEFSDILIPDFPPPNLKLNLLFFSNVNKPLIAINNFELTLIDSFVIPLTNIYGNINNTNQFEFITRNVSQFLLEIKKNMKKLINFFDFEVINIPIKSSISKYKQLMENNNEKSKSQLENQSTIKTNGNNRLKTPDESEQSLDDEYIFYEKQLQLMNGFYNNIIDEIEFTKYVQQQSNNNLNNNNIQMNEIEIDINNKINNKINNNTFLNKMCCEVDKIYSEYCIDFMNIEYEQSRHKNELKRKKLRINDMKKYYTHNDNFINDNRNRFINQLDMDINMTGKLMFKNLIQSNKCNDFTEDKNEHFDYLRRFHGYNMNKDDTLEMNTYVKT